MIGAPASKSWHRVQCRRVDATDDACPGIERGHSAPAFGSIILPKNRLSKIRFMVEQTITKTGEQFECKSCPDSPGSNHHSHFRTTRRSPWVAAPWTSLPPCVGCAPGSSGGEPPCAVPGGWPDIGRRPPRCPAPGSHAGRYDGAPSTADDGGSRRPHLPSPPSTASSRSAWARTSASSSTLPNASPGRTAAKVR